MFRRFHGLQARLIQEKQDEMRLMEEEISRRDIEDDAKDPPQIPPRLKSRRRRDRDEAESRSKLFQRAEKKFLEYGRIWFFTLPILASHDY